MKRHFLSYITLISLPFSQSAYAAGLDSGDMLNKILESFSTVAATWQSEITSSASWLFWGLAIISMTWTYGLMVLRNADIGDFFGETIRFFGTLGLFWWLLKNGPAISLSIINTMRTISAQASGLGSGLSPSSIVDIGFNILTKVSSSASLLSPVLSTMMIGAAIVVLVILALIAVNMLLLLVAAWLLAYAGVFLLGFGGSRWTSDIAINFYKTVLGIGVQLFTMTFLIGVGKSFLDQYYKAFEAGTPDLNSLCVLLVASVVLLMLVNRLPPMLAGIIGSAGQSSGIGSFGAGAAIGAATMTASAIASAGSVALAGANEVAGGTSALSAAFKAAQASAETTGATIGNIDNYQSASSSHGKSAFGHAMDSGTVEGSRYTSREAKAGRLAPNAASLVANQMGQKISHQASAAIADTTGGRLATATDESSKSPKTGDDLEFEGYDPIDECDEVSAFVNSSSTQD